MTTQTNRLSNGTQANGTPSRLKAKSPGITEPGKTKAVMYGPSGVGKTWFSLSFPTPYYFDTEGGADGRHYQEKLANAGGRYLGPEDGTLDFEFLIDQIKALATEPHDFKTLIVDSITKLFQSAIANEQERLGEKDAFGASKKPAVAAMRRVVNWITKLDMNVWFIAHETAEWGLNPKTGQREEVGKVPDVWDKLIYELDLGLWVQKKAGVRAAFVKKSRLLGFPDGDVFTLDYEEFAGRYGKDFIEAAATQIKLATAEQVGEITRLLSVVKVSEAEIEKVMTKAGAESWYELTSEQADSTVAWLKKKLA
jgi:hypothetical protein